MTITVAPRYERESTPVVRQLRLALAGCGVVGGELLRVLARRRNELVDAYGLDVEVVTVLVRDATRRRDVPLDRELFTSDVERFLETPADVVVEAIGGFLPAALIARTTLDRGATFVTANKALVASYGDVLFTTAARTGATLRFDAAVGGGVPVLRLIEGALGGARPRAVRGILNGTSNFVLTRLERGATFDAALAEARQSGFAEFDATRDLDGSDAADKIAIVAWAAFGISPERVIVRRQSLLPDPVRLVRVARAAGGRLRLVAECELVHGGRGVVASVEPVVVAADSPFGRTTLENNTIEIDTGWSAPLHVSGPGAGAAPTATSLLSDLLAGSATPRVRGTPPVAVEDERAFRWVVGARLAPRLLSDLLERHGVPVEEACTVASESCATTTRLSLCELRQALAILTAANRNPIAIRLGAGVDILPEEAR
jgi:homoserine dehydrogenase